MSNTVKLTGKSNGDRRPPLDFDLFSSFVKVFGVPTEVWKKCIVSNGANNPDIKSFPPLN